MKIGLYACQATVVPQNYIPSPFSQSGAKVVSKLPMLTLTLFYAHESFELGSAPDSAS